MRKWCRKQGLGKDLVERALETTTHKTSAPPELHFQVDLFNTDCYRAVAKIACNLFAVHNAVSFLRDGFNDIRHWVLGTMAITPPPIEVIPPLPPGGKLGDFDHLVRVTVSDDGAVEGIVQLLGSFAFAVNLGNEAPGSPRTMSYRVDQIGRTQSRDSEADVSLAAESYAKAAERSYEQFLELCKLHHQALWPRVLQCQRHALIE